MEQVNAQGVPATEGKEAKGRPFGIDLGQPGGLLPVHRSSQHRPQEEEAQVGKQGEIVRGSKPVRRKAQDNEPGEGNVPCPEPKPGSGERRAQHPKGPGGQLPETAPQEHAHTQAVQNPKVDDDFLPGKAQKIHAQGHRRADHAAGEDEKPPPGVTASQGGAGAGQQEKEHPAPILHKGEPLWICHGHQGVELHQVIDKVDDHHAQDAQPPESIQLPDPLFHGCCSWAALASSSSTR